MTPIRRQYLAIKRQYPDAIVFFRLGDFYETFDDDAKIVSSDLDIVLTSREMGKGQRVPLAGIPYHSVEGHLAKLIAKGHKVAIVEQVSDPATTKGLVEREVVRVVTPGTVVEPHMLDNKANNFLAGVVVDGFKAGIAFVDITTGEFSTTQLAGNDVPQLVAQEIERLRPAECLVPKEDPQKRARLQGADILDHASTHLTHYDAWHFDIEHCRQTIQEHFGVVSLEGFGCVNLPLAIRAAGAILQYLEETQKAALGQLQRLNTYSTDSFMVLDMATRHNLELVQTSRTGSTRGSLLWVLDRTRTPMGGRLLRRWVNQPLLDITRLRARQDAVREFVGDTALRARIVAQLDRVGDMERIITRVSQGVATPRDLVALRGSLVVVPEMQKALSENSGIGSQERSKAVARKEQIATGENAIGATDDSGMKRECANGDRYSTRIAWLAHRLDPCEEIVELVAQAAVADPPNSLADGGVIAAGFSDELDNLRATSKDARQWVARLEAEEREKTGIKSLKVGYNRVFGYYIEISNPNLEQPMNESLRRSALLNATEMAACACKTVHEHLERCFGYIRKQTLVGAERFITPALKEKEAFILGAQERIVELETRIFKQVCEQIGAAAQRITTTAATLAHTDVFVSLAEVAVQNNYVCPELSTGDKIKIVGGRHPVVELMLEGEQFVPNEVHLSNGDSQIIILTGPNMAGKSTYGLMVAQIVLMAQLGSFVPAEAATIGLVDRIFTRVGAQHDITMGQSTFLVEMSEGANILNNATPRSLVILDEVGRGTSTYDGMAVAQAIVEYIHNHPKLGCKTIFATHYHELTAMEGILPRVKNYRVDVLEEGGRVVFLHRVVPGGADRSYGIHVAKLAGIPKAVIRRAEEVLKDLESGSQGNAPVVPKETRVEPLQLAMFGGPDPVLEELKSLDVVSMSPLEAITKLFELQKKVGRRNSS
ncbi:MAG: DNA mismatch repair protein MutS [Chloroflexi bacterium]|nr:DNA mismatch repair protein MutS [Chloroflexota bacterium]